MGLRTAGLAISQRLGAVLAREVEQDEGDEDRQQALTRQHEHRDPGEEEDEPQRVAGDEDREAEGRVRIGPHRGPAFGTREVVRGEAGDDQRDADEREHERRGRSDTEPPEEGLVRSAQLSRSSSMVEMAHGGTAKMAVAQRA